MINIDFNRLPRRQMTDSVAGGIYKKHIKANSTTARSHLRHNAAAMGRLYEKKKANRQQECSNLMSLFIQSGTGVWMSHHQWMVDTFFNHKKNRQIGDAPCI